MEGGDAKLLALGSNVLGSQHGSVGRGLVTVGANFHAAGDANDGFPSGQIGDMDKGVIEGGKDASNTKDEFAGTGTGSEGNVFFGLGFSDFLKRRELVYPKDGWIGVVLVPS